MNIKSTILCLAIGLTSVNAFADAKVDKKCSDEIQKRAGVLKAKVFKTVGACLKEIQKCNLLVGGKVQLCKENALDVTKKGKCSSAAIDGGNLLFGPGSAANSSNPSIKAINAKALNAFVKGVQKQCFDAGADLAGLGYTSIGSATALVDGLNRVNSPTGYACNELSDLNATIPNMVDLLQDLMTLDDSLGDSKYEIAPSLRFLVGGTNLTDCALVPFNP